MVQPLTAAFGQIGKKSMEAAATGASPWNAWRTTVLPRLATAAPQRC